MTFCDKSSCSSKLSRKDNIEILDEWLRHVLPMKKDSHVFSEVVGSLAGIESFDEDVALICHSKKKSAKLAELKKTLEGMYHRQVKVF